MLRRRTLLECLDRTTLCPAASRSRNNTTMTEPRRSPLAITALVIAGIAVLGCIWLAVDGARRETKLREQVLDYLARGDRAGSETRQLADYADTIVRGMDGRVSAIEQKLADWQGQQLAMEALYRNLAKTRDEWLLGEIEQLLLIANQQLELANNVSGALNALQTADQILQRHSQPVLIPLRRAVAQDIEGLRGVAQRDVVGSIARIDALIAAADAWPLAHQFSNLPARTPVITDSDGWMSRIWADLRNLVRVQYLPGRALPLVSPESTLFLRENIRLRLTAARYAALRGDEPQLRRELDLSREWLERYFSGEAESVRSAIDQLRALRAVEVSTRQPDIQASLQAARKARRAFDTGG